MGLWPKRGAPVSEQEAGLSLAHRSSIHVVCGFRLSLATFPAVPFCLTTFPRRRLLQGPCVASDTACSSSLVAAHLGHNGALCLSLSSKK